MVIINIKTYLALLFYKLLDKFSGCYEDEGTPALDLHQILFEQLVRQQQKDKQKRRR